MHPIFNNYHVPKPMLMTETIQFIEKNLDNFRVCGCAINCVKTHCSCKKKILLPNMFLINYMN